MAKSYRTFEHTADIGLEARADSLAELFEALGEGLAEQICPRESVRPEQAAALDVQAEDAENLLHDFLGALLELFHLEKFLTNQVQVERIDGTSVTGTARGETFDPARHELSCEIKAVTYHLLSVTRDGNGWCGTVVLDI